MSLKDRITEDMKDAMRARQADRLSTIRMLLAACKQREVDERITLDDVAVIGIVDKLIKQRKDSIAAFAQAGRTDLVDKETAEIAVLQAYLPQRLDAAQIANARQNTIREFAEHPQLMARGRWQTVGSPVGSIQALAPPVIMVGVEAVMEPIPSVGEHTDDILREIGVDARTVEEWKRAGIA